jgi:hypothetical protein
MIGIIKRGNERTFPNYVGLILISELFVKSFIGILGSSKIFSKHISSREELI